jgi:hypothetical protein
VHHERALQRVLLAPEPKEVAVVDDEAVGKLELTDLEFARPPGESAERVSVSPTGGELSLDVGGALDHQIHGGTLAQQHRRRRKSKRHNE